MRRRTLRGRLNTVLFQWFFVLALVAGAIRVLSFPGIRRNLVDDRLLLAPTVAGVIDQVLEGREHGPFGGMTGVQARVKGALFPGDTVHVEGEAWLRPPTSCGYTLMDLRHRVINQHGEVLVDFTETITFLPRGTVEAE